MRKIVVTRHALERYQERVRPGLTVEQVRAELAQILPQTTLVTEAPPWCDTRRGDKWALVTEGIVFPLEQSRDKLYATTCLTKGETRPERREAKNAFKAKRRHARALKRKLSDQRRDAKRNRDSNRTERRRREQAA